MKAVWKRGLAGALLVMALTGCGGSGPSTPKAVPLGDKAALEKLAAAYTKVSDKEMTVSPMNLPGDERKKFLEKVFAEAGYDYAATLHALAQPSFDKRNQLQADLAELVLMPHRHPRVPMDPLDIYGAESLKDVAAIERAMNK